MNALNPSLGGIPPNRIPPSPGLRRRLAGMLPSVLVFLSLVAFAYWGHTTGWNFTAKTSGDGSTIESPSVIARPTVRSTPTNDLNSVLPGRHVSVEFDSDAAVRTAGIDTSVAWSSGMTEQIIAAGEVAFDPKRVGRISARVNGVARRVFKATGDPVRAGELLAIVDSKTVGQAKADFQQALVQWKLKDQRRNDLIQARSVASEATIREAEAAVKDAEVRVLGAVQTLGNLGLSVSLNDYRTLSTADTAKRLRGLGLDDGNGESELNTVTTLLPIRSPFAGVVLSSDVVVGEVVETGRVLMTVVDASRIWITLHVAAESATRASVGQRVFFRPDGDVREHPANVVWVGSAADESTRTVPVRAEAVNADGTLRSSNLGRGRLVFREEPHAIVLPHEAIKTFRGRTIVFVRDPDYFNPGGVKAFHVRAVTVGGRDEKNAEILTGVVSGDVVASTGSDVLLAELTRAKAD